MKVKQFRSVVERLDLSHGELSSLLGTNIRTSRRWFAGDTEVPEHVAMLLALMAETHTTPEQVLHIKDRRWPFKLSLDHAEQTALLYELMLAKGWTPQRTATLAGFA